MERFVHIGGRFWDRVNTEPEDIARSLEATDPVVTPFDDPVCGPSERVDLQLRPLGIGDLATKVAKRMIIRKAQTLWNRMTVDPQGGGLVVSPATRDALGEAIGAMDRSDWKLAAALLTVKSHLVGQPSEDRPFWEDRERNDALSADGDVYQQLDHLQFIAAMRAGVIPAGMVVYSAAEGGGIVKQEAAVVGRGETTSPTLRLLAEEREPVVRQCDTPPRHRNPGPGSPLR